MKTKILYVCGSYTSPTIFRSHLTYQSITRYYISIVHTVQYIWIFLHYYIHVDHWTLVKDNQKILSFWWIKNTKFKCVLSHDQILWKLQQIYFWEREVHWIHWQVAINILLQCTHCVYDILNRILISGEFRNAFNKQQN